MIELIEPMGYLIREAAFPGETRAEAVVPSDANGILISRDRWLLVYATRGFRGVDDDRSILYQLRAEAPDGQLIREGILARSIDDWDPMGDGSTYVKQHGHPVAFGVPRGALIRGRPAPSSNLFVVKWRRCARVLDPHTGRMPHASTHPVLSARTQAVEWMQLRLNDASDDIEIVQPPTLLVEKEYNGRSAFCSAPLAWWMNQAFTQAIPWNEDATEWADCNHFNGGRVAALRYAFNRELDRYEWVETGPFLQDPAHALSEASLVRYGSDWVICARTDPADGGVAWVRTPNPFAVMPAPVYPGEPSSNAPVTAYGCPDGVLRLFGGDVAASPHRNGRDPLYCWDVDPDRGFACSHRRVVLDSVAAGLPIRRESLPRVDMAKLLPHPGGRHGVIAHRIRPKSILDPHYTGVAVNDAEKACSGIYYARVTYTEELPAAWEFSSTPESTRS